MLYFVLAFVDMSTGLQATESHGADTSVVCRSYGGKAGAVLWDQTHGVYLEYSLNGRFSSMRDTLMNHGYSFDTTVNGVNNESLDNYRIVVLNLGSNWNSAYTQEEADSVAAFVARGGSVLIQSENTGCPNSNLNLVVNTFEMSVGLGNPQTTMDSFSTNPTYSSMFTGVSSVTTQAPGQVGASGQSEEIAWFGGAPGVVGRCESDHGGVVLVSDINLWDNTNITNADNATMLINVFDWLSDPPCAPTSAGEKNSSSTQTLLVSPVPASQFLRVVLPVGLDHAVLYNSAGAPVMKLHQGRVDISCLAPGVYFLKAGDQSRPVIIER